jgi:cytochrome c
VGRAIGLPLLPLLLLLGLSLPMTGTADAAQGASVVPAVGRAAPPSAAQVEAGRRLFARCAGCHAVGPKAGNLFGPQLNGILGRRAGSVPGYGYSPAMKKSTLVWNAQNLNAFIRDSDKVIPGNKMRFFNFMSQKQVADIVAYLATQPAAAAK